MSSAIRSIQKRMFKARGFVRQTQKVVPGELPGMSPRVITLKRGEGDIIGPDQQSWGKHWPRSLPLSDEAVPDRQKPREGAPRGSRRGTHKRPHRQAA